MKTAFVAGVVLALLLSVIASAGTADGSSRRKGVERMSFEIRTKAFKNMEPIPARNTGDGSDVSPPMEWSNPPEGTKAFALICDDPDAPVGTWVHWVLYDVPPDVLALAEGVAKEQNVLKTAKQGINDFHRIGYDGPAPPRGKTHRYFFKLYALSKETGLGPGATKSEVLKAMEGSIVGQAQLIGTYRR